MRKVLIGIIILTFIAIDWLIFHDILKPGEKYTVVQYLTGMVSIPTVILLFLDIFKKDNAEPVKASP